MSAQFGSIRGPLKYTVETSSPQLEAGRKFSVAIRITNPYDVPVTIQQVVTKLPAKFLSLTARQQRSFRERWRDFLKAADEQSGGHGRAEGTEAGRVVAAVSQNPNDESAAVLLQPGNSTVRVFALLALGWLLFTPSTYNLNLEIIYDIDGKPNRDTVSYQLSVRSPLRAIIAGTIVGSIVGFIVRDNAKDQTLHTFFSTGDGVLDLTLSIVSHVIGAAMIVVAFARKKDAQPILSIEDFYGGLFIGFVAAYGGKSLLNQVTSLPAVAK